ncbi:hypothetical protein C8R45DRAFT_873192, partial [Mycena sanguinolenta]
MSGTIGRPKGSKNQPDHKAGGARPGSGPKARDSASISSANMTTSNNPRQQTSIQASTRERRPITGNGIAELYPIFKPRLSQQISGRTETENLGQSQASPEVPNTFQTAPFPFLPPEPLEMDPDEASGADSDFEDILEEPVPSKPLPDEANIDTAGIISLYLTGIKSRLKAELNSGKWPKCYEQGSFWIHPPAPFFALQKAVKPADLYYPSVFVWFPHLFKLGTKFTCPHKDCQHFKDVLHPLEIKGFNDKPVARHVIGLDSVYYVITLRIQCKKDSDTGCGRSWNLYDPLILDQMDRGLADCFPAFFTARSGIDKTLMTLIRAGIAHRLSASAWSKILRELHVPKYLMKLNGVMTFVALFTIVNEFEQIHFQAFVLTKSLSHIHAPLEGILKSLKAYGLPQPILGFTDNVASDAATFMQYLPSLGENV